MGKSKVTAMDKLIGKLIRHYRKKRDLTICDVAALMKAEGEEVSVQMVGYYERGMFQISSCRLKKLADVLGVEISQLYPVTNKAQRKK